MNNAIVDLMGDVDQDDQASTWQNALNFFEKFGFHIVNYGIIDKNRGDLLGFHSNMDEDWMAYYMEQKYSDDDPWANYVISHSAPVLYAEDGPSELIIPEGSIAEKMLK